ncbi:MAG TPA: potassium-transporting ATPase subunit KdpC [Sphingobium sp.]|nr:potassium-transporting ATPase subunit KdpC [Sphingobium sp.]
MLSDLRSALRPALVLTLLFALLLGIIYPLVLTGMGQALFPAQANGSLIRDGDRVIGSALIGQAFAGERYFHGRPSAAGAKGYDAAASAGSNLGPASKALAERVRNDREALAESAPGQPVPPDLVTTSASGLDPHISPQAALYQVDRVARARGLPAGQVRRLVETAIERRLLGFIGEPRVNVLALNRALDRLANGG